MFSAVDLPFRRLLSGYEYWRVHVVNYHIHTIGDFYWIGTRSFVEPVLFSFSIAADVCVLAGLQHLDTQCNNSQHLDYCTAVLLRRCHI